MAHFETHISFSFYCLFSSFFYGSDREITVFLVAVIFPPGNFGQEICLCCFPLSLQGISSAPPQDILLSELWLSGKISVQWLDFLLPLSFYFSLWLMRAVYSIITVWKTSCFIGRQAELLIIKTMLVELERHVVNQSVCPVTEACVSGLTLVWTRGNCVKVLEQLDVLGFFLEDKKKKILSSEPADQMCVCSESLDDLCSSLRPQTLPV